MFYHNTTDEHKKKYRKIAFKKLMKGMPSYLWDFSVIRYRFGVDTINTLYIYLDWFSMSFEEFVDKYKKIYWKNMPDMSSLNQVPCDRSREWAFILINADITIPEIKKKLSQSGGQMAINKHLFMLTE